MQPELRVALVDMSWPGYRSLALGYVRAYAAADRRLAGRVGLTTLDLDSDADPWWVAYRLDDLRPDVVGFSVTCWNARSVFDAARLLAASRPDTCIVLGGPEVGPIAGQVLADHPYIDAVVRGEGEETFADLLDALLERRPLAEVAGVSSRTDAGIVSAPDRPLIADLDSIPSPYTTGVMTPVDGSTYIETYRGCPHRCGYCFEGKGYGRIRKFSRERVAEEIAVVATAPGVRSFSFIDPVFNLTDEYLSWLADTLEPFARDGIRLHTIEVDVERIGTTQAAELRRAGVQSVETGPQSVGSAALKACRRAFDRDAFAAGVAACRAQGIRVECDFIIGLPGDTAHDVDDGLRFALALDPGKIQVSTLHVLPGTDLWDRAEEFGLVFDSQPPHEIVRTRDLGFSDLRRAEVFGMTLARLYGARVDTDSERTTL
jgi:radical SAM superfamily enzyme YgiQ (UPF0313 family)